MRKPGLVGFVVAVLILFGIWSLPHLNKDEFPQFTIRQGVVAVPYPGATAEEAEAQVTKPLERYLFSFPEINKQTCYSYSKDGMVYVFADLRNDVSNKDEAWSKIRHGLNLFRQTSLPAGVPAVVVFDDFGNTSSVLLAIEGDGRTPRELENYAGMLCDRLRTLRKTGNIKIVGEQKEEIAVTLLPERLSAYQINPATLLTELSMQGFRTTSGSVSGSSQETHLHVDVPYSGEYDIEQQIIFSNPLTGQVVRLGDVAEIERRYEDADRYVRYYQGAGSREQTKLTGAAPCLIVSVEIYPGNNIVAYGEEVDKIIDETRALLPPDIRLHRITDQPRVVSQSVMSFLRDLVFSIFVVILVMLVLFPLKTALVSSTGVPVCIAIALGLMYLFGIELNTVTLAALIVVLGMIVDDSVIVIDGYTNLLAKGHSRWYSAIVSTTALFVPMTLATCAISGMFFPMTHIISGPLGEFVQLFPWAVCFALTASIFYAAWVIPSLATRYISNTRTTDANWFERGQNRFFALLQKGYERVLHICFRHPWLTLLVGTGAVALGVWVFTRLNVQMLPKAERECFAVEIHLRSGSTTKATAAVADSVAKVLSADSRVLCVTSFIGSGSPRFHATYSPQMPRSNYAQFVVTTRSLKATSQILKEYGPRYAHAFPDAYVRFKQLDYQPVRNPVEVYIEGDDLDALHPLADSVKYFLAGVKGTQWVHSDYDGLSSGTRIVPDDAQAGRLGVSQTMLSLWLNSVTHGTQLTSVWEDDYEVPVRLYVDCDKWQTGSKDAPLLSEDLPVPTATLGRWVTLRQVAHTEPYWSPESITHRNGRRTITVGCDLIGRTPQPEVQKTMEQYVAAYIEPRLPEGAKVSFGGLTAVNEAVIPDLVWSVVAALLVMFVLLIYHFGKIRVAVLALAQSLLCMFGACLGLWLFRLDFSITALLGLVSLIGIIVRNAIIMYEYAEKLLYEKHIPLREAAFQAGLRRMRPIFLTSATTALGVTPMIVAATSLWMPMGVVICFGTLFTLPLVVTVLPVAYWKTFAINRPRGVKS